MFKKRAIIIALDAIIQVHDGPQGYHWSFDPQLPGLLGDYKALGYRLIGILSPVTFGLDLDGVADELELAAYLNTMLGSAEAPALDAIHFPDDVTDPRPIWDLRRRFGVSLGRSILVATDPSYETLRSNAGIGHMEWAETLLGSLCQPLAAVG